MVSISGKLLIDYSSRGSTLLIDGTESIETIVWVKLRKTFEADPGSGMEKFGAGIRDNTASYQLKQ